ncbi:MAG: 30S ribosomal protein S9 [archaeon]
MKRKTKKKISEFITVSGKRKTSIAKATIKPGSGKVTINNKPINLFTETQRLLLEEPLILTRDLLKEEANKVDISVAVTGGGTESRVEASRLAIARAIIAHFNKPELRESFLNYDRNLLVADTRRKETCKPNDSKARAKRQKSYR